MFNWFSIKTVFNLLEFGWNFHFDIWVKDWSYKRCETIYKNFLIY